MGNMECPSLAKARLREYDYGDMTQYPVALVEEIVRARWEWRDIPIWRYALRAHDLERG